MKYTRHVVGDMAGFTQCCVICGKLISDYRNVMVPAGQGFPRGFDAGDVYVSGGITTTIINEHDESEDCKYQS